MYVKFDVNVKQDLNILLFYCNYFYKFLTFLNVKKYFQILIYINRISNE